MAADSLRRLAARVDRWHWLFLALAAPFLLFPGADAACGAGGGGGALVIGMASTPRAFSGYAIQPAPAAF